MESPGHKHPIGKVIRVTGPRKVIVSIYNLNGEKHEMFAPPDDVRLMKGREVYLALDRATVVLYPQEVESEDTGTDG